MPARRDWKRKMSKRSIRGEMKEKKGVAKKKSMVGIGRSGACCGRRRGV